MEKFLPLALGLLALVACNKHDSSARLPPLAPLAATKDINIDLAYLDDNDSLKKDMWELIVSEPIGGVLLDSVAHVNTNISALLHVNAFAVDVTAVYYNSQSNVYSAITYLNVDPTSWKGLPTPGPINVIDVGNPPVTTLTTNFIHPPNLTKFTTPGISISDNIYNYGTPTVYYRPNYSAYQPGGLLSVTYFRNGTGPIFTLLPQLGLYNIHEPPATGSDTVDLTYMDTATMITYAVPSGYTKNICRLGGFTDTTDLSRSMGISNNPGSSGVSVDLDFPPKGFQTYLMMMDIYKNSPSEYLTYSTYDTHVPSTINWITAADYTINANQQDNFSVSFGNPKPTFYRADWKSGNNFFEIYSAPNDVPLHPITWFGSLGSKLLQGQSLSPLTADRLFIEQGQGFGADYNSLLSFYAKAPFPNTYPSGVAATSYQISF